MKTAFYAGVAASALLCHAPTMAAALTPDEVWERWQAQAAEADMSIVAGGETSSGDTLTLTDVAFVADLKDGTNINGTIAEVTLSDAGGGTVNVVMSDSIPITASGENFDGTTGTVAMTISAPGLVYTVGDGPEGGIEASYSAPQMVVSIDSVSEDGEPVDMSGTITGTEVSGEYVVTGSDADQVDSSVTTGVLTINFEGSDDEEGGDVAFNMIMNDINSSVSSTGGVIAMMAGPSALEDGGTMQAEGRASDITLAISAQDTPESFDLSFTMDGGTGAANITDDRVEYDVLYEGIAFAASGSEIPFPQVTGGLGAWETDVSVPSGTTDEAVPADIRVALRDIVMGEEIWMMFDPGGAMGRDPATLVLDIASQVRVIGELFGEDMMGRGEAPVEPEALTLNELLVSVAGASLAGTGDFAFDWSQPGPFGPDSPQAEGTLNLSLTGGQALLQTLVGMGLVPQQQASMLLGMVGMVAQPGNGPDELVSEITLQRNGCVSANGLQLPLPC